MMFSLENKKLHFIVWLLLLILLIWGFFHPHEYMGKKWDYVTTKEGQYTILFLLLVITLARLVQLYLAIKNESK